MTGVVDAESKRTNFGSDKDPAGCNVAVTEQGVVGGSEGDGFGESPMLCPSTGCVHDGSHDAYQ